MISYADVIVSLEQFDLIELEIIRNVIDGLTPRRTMTKTHARPDYRQERRRRIELVIKIMQKEKRAS
jgi:hypothetical protein